MGVNRERAISRASALDTALNAYNRCEDAYSRTGKDFYMEAADRAADRYIELGGDPASVGRGSGQN
jgi:hypothetical protein